MTLTRQPSLEPGLVRDAREVVAKLAASMPQSDAAVRVHAGAVAQHAVTVGLVGEGLAAEQTLAAVADLHPGLSGFAALPPLLAQQERAVAGLWQQHTLMEPGDGLPWWSYPLGDLYQELSVEARKGRALCQTPGFVGELLLDMSYDRAVEVWDRPLVIDPACGTGHLLLEAFVRASGGGSDARVVAALDQVHGCDIDPYAVLVARWRLLVLAWAGLQHRNTPRVLRDLPLHVACADSLLAADEPVLTRGRYHVVVANPPYITVKDPAVNAAIRSRYPETCSGKYSLALPFAQLMFELAVPGGWVAQLTADSFMKREFGKRFIEKFLPRYDAQWVIDSSGAYIPGHGTPTVILVHRNQPPGSSTVRVVQGVRGEPNRPDDPAQGLVWTAIRNAVRLRESAERFERGARAAERASQPAIAATQPAEPPKQMTLFELLGDAA